MIIFHTTFNVKPGKREELLQKIWDNNVQEEFRACKGILAYNFFLSTDNPDQLFLRTVFENQEALDGHFDVPISKVWHALRDEYVESKSANSYNAEKR